MPQATSGTQPSKPNAPIEGLDQDGQVQRYKIENGILTIYTLKDNALEDAVKTGGVEGRFVKAPAPDGSIDVAVLDKLDEAAQQFLARLADDEIHWTKMQYTRVKDLEAELASSQAYPAGADTAANSTVSIQLPDFQSFCEGKAELFRRHLQASPEWFVMQDRNAIVARRRDPKKSFGRPDIASNGFFSNAGERVPSTDPLFSAFGKPVEKQDRYQIRYLFRFDAGTGMMGQLPSHWFGWQRQLKIVTPTEGDVQLKLKRDVQGIESVLAVGRPGLWFEFFEQTWKEDRLKTRAAVEWLGGFSRDLWRAAKEIEENGYAASQMPEGAIGHGQPKLELVYPHQDSLTAVDIHGAVNPGRQGFVFLKAFDATSGASLDEQIGVWHSKEYIGWSKHPDTLFPCYIQLNIPQELTRKGMQLRFELWFRPTDGGPGEAWFAKESPGDVKLAEVVKIH